MGDLISGPNAGSSAAFYRGDVGILSGLTNKSTENLSRGAEWTCNLDVAT